MSRSAVRISQMVTTFGPGALIDFPESSVIVAGLDQWHYERDQIPTVDEPRLRMKVEQILQRTGMTLRSPPPASDQEHGFRPDVTAWRFPTWFIVQRTIETARGYRRRRLVSLEALDKMQFRDEDTKKYPVVPVRFVRACRKGHIGDIDWKAFVHGEGIDCVRNLWIEERGTSGDLDEVWIICECGRAERAMSQAARLALKALGSCNGGRPWLGPGTREGCGEPNRLLIRNASHAYFPQLLSVISIPDSRATIDEVVRSLWDDFLSDVDTLDALAKCRKKRTVAARLQGLGDDEVFAAIERQRSGRQPTDRPVKEVEFEALAEAREELGSDVPDGHFYARSLKRTVLDARFHRFIERVVLVHRLREVVAEVGFTRFEAAGPDINGELSLAVERAALAIDADWVPAIENRGEGLFLLFSSQAIQEWLARREVKKRGSALVAGFDRWKAEHEGSRREFFGLPYYALHSLSHLLITAIALECGYPPSSLRERVYAARDRYGLLLFTGSSDAEGTLGGLVQSGWNIDRHLRHALELGLLCSNDPVCACHVPREHDPHHLVGSACHGCLLIAETSCEQHNDFLDRSLVVKTVEDLGCELFEGIG